MTTGLCHSPWKGIAVTGLVISLGAGVAKAESNGPITGATGAYSDAAVLEQTLLGFLEHGGVKVRFQIPSM